MHDFYLKAASPKQPTPRKGTETLLHQCATNDLRNNPHPARGRKLLMHTLSGQETETTHTPQGDGNLLYAGRFFGVFGNNPHPARGRKPLAYVRTFLTPRNNPHPARGRKLPAPLPRSSQRGNNPHPARGRKPLIARGGGSALTETTHTPQGDGNRLAPLMGLYKLRNNPHPARGRKPPPGREAHQPLETTHTPQGDGNLFDVHAFLRTRKQPTPRKGTETAYCSRMFGLSQKQPTPRKGTETSA